LLIKAILIPKNGIPLEKLKVPSIGSMTQLISLIIGLLSSLIIPYCGNFLVSLLIIRFSDFLSEIVKISSLPFFCCLIFELKSFKKENREEIITLYFPKENKEFNVFNPDLKDEEIDAITSEMSQLLNYPYLEQEVLINAD